MFGKLELNKRQRTRGGTGAYRHLFAAFVRNYRGVVMNCGSAAVIRRLVQSYPEEVVLEQLRNVYRREVGRALAEVGELLPRYCSAVDGPTYRFTLNRLDLVAAYTRAEGASVSTLEALLKALLRQKQILAVLPAPSRTP